MANDGPWPAVTAGLALVAVGLSFFFGPAGMLLVQWGLFGLLAAIAMYAWGRPGPVVRRPALAAWALAALLAIDLVLWLTAGGHRTGGLSTGELTNFLLCPVACAAFAERAHAAGRPGLATSLVLATGAYLAVFPHLTRLLWGLPVPMAAAFLGIPLLQRLPLPRWGHVGLALLFGVAALSLDVLVGLGWNVWLYRAFAFFVAAAYAWLWARPMAMRPVATAQPAAPA